MKHLHRIGGRAAATWTLAAALAACGTTPKAKIGNGKAAVVVGTLIGAGTAVGAVALADDVCTLSDCDLTAPVALSVVGGAVATSMVAAGWVSIEQAHDEQQLAREAEERAKERKALVEQMDRLRPPRTGGKTLSRACATLCSGEPSTDARLSCFRRCREEGRLPAGGGPVGEGDDIELRPRRKERLRTPWRGASRSDCQWYCRRTQSGEDLLECLKSCPPPETDGADGPPP